MRPETKDKLDRLLRRQRRRLWLVLGSVSLIFVALATVFFAPREPLDHVTAKLVRFQSLPSDDQNAAYLIASLPDGSTIRVAYLSGDAVLEPGTTLCLLRLRHPVFDSISHTRVPMSRCRTGGS